MKAILMIVLLVLPVTTYAEVLEYRDDIKPKYFNDVWKIQYVSSMQIYYNPGKDSFDFYLEETLYRIGFSLSRNQADSLIEAIDKYKDWNIKATTKGITLEKEISKVSSSDTCWKLGKGDWNFGMGVDFELYFFSKTKKVHQLVILFPKFKGKYDKYFSYQPDPVYFDYDEAIKLRDSLKKEAISNFIIKAKRQAEIDAEFK